MALSWFSDVAALLREKEQVSWTAKLRSTISLKDKKQVHSALYVTGGLYVIQF